MSQLADFSAVFRNFTLASPERKLIWSKLLLQIALNLCELTKFNYIIYNNLWKVTLLDDLRLEFREKRF